MLCPESKRPARQCRYCIEAPAFAVPDQKQRFSVCVRTSAALLFRPTGCKIVKTNLSSHTAQAKNCPNGCVQQVIAHWIALVSVASSSSSRILRAGTTRRRSSLPRRQPASAADPAASSPGACGTASNSAMHPAPLPRSHPCGVKLYSSA